MGLDLILGLVGTLGGMILPPVVDFIKKRFIPAENDTPERTIGTLATTQPATVAPYVEALAKYYQAQTSYFNRDVVGNPSLWVINLRACIRPIVVISSFIVLGTEVFTNLKLDPATRAGMLTVVGNWIGSRIIQP
jgi:hypothetical protein